MPLPYKKFSAYLEPTRSVHLCHACPKFSAYLEPIQIRASMPRLPKRDRLGMAKLKDCVYAKHTVVYFDKLSPDWVARIYSATLPMGL